MRAGLNVAWPCRADRRSTPPPRRATARRAPARACRSSCRTRRCRIPARGTSGRPTGSRTSRSSTSSAGVLRRELGADLLAVLRGLGVGRLRLLGERRPDRQRGVLEFSRADPALLNGRIDVGRVGRRAGHAREAVRAVVRLHDGTGLLAELHEGAVAQREPRLIERVEGLQDQQRHRLAHVERRLADRAEQVAGVELRHADAGLVEIVGGHHHGGLHRAGEAREVHADVDMRRVGRAHDHRVRGRGRPAGQVVGAIVGGVELGAGDLGDAVDAAAAVERRIPFLLSRQRRRSPAPDDRRDRLSAMPLAVTHVTNSRREGRMHNLLGARSSGAWRMLSLGKPDSRLTRGTHN